MNAVHGAGHALNIVELLLERVNGHGNGRMGK
jgi:hypothetical protein